MPSLPAHLYGRGDFGGPNAGGYSTVLLGTTGATAVTPGAATTVIGKYLLPQDCRLEQIIVGVVTSSGGASRPTVNVNDGTANVLAADLQSVTASAVGAVNFTAARREQAKNNILTVNMTTVATEAVTNLSVWAVFHVKGHVNADKAND